MQNGHKVLFCSQANHNADQLSIDLDQDEEVQGELLRVYADSASRGALHFGPDGQSYKTEAEVLREKVEPLTFNFKLEEYLRKFKWKYRKVGQLGSLQRELHQGQRLSSEKRVAMKRLTLEIASEAIFPEYMVVTSTLTNSLSDLMKTFNPDW